MDKYVGRWTHFWLLGCWMTSKFYISLQFFISCLNELNTIPDFYYFVFSFETGEAACHQHHYGSDWTQFRIENVSPLSLLFRRIYSCRSAAIIYFNQFRHFFVPLHIRHKFHRFRCDFRRYDLLRTKIMWIKWNSFRQQPIIAWMNWVERNVYTYSSHKNCTILVTLIRAVCCAACYALVRPNPAFSFALVRQAEKRRKRERMGERESKMEESIW